jgi:ubiquinone/menaquinone biosynthesis C-methylase UbiE
MAPPDPIRILDTLRAYQKSAALKSAIDLGLFTAIAGGASTLSEIAADCAASERGIRILCDSLVVNQFLEKTDGAYRNTPDAALFLDRKSPAYLGVIADFLCRPEEAAATMSNMAETVRRGGTVMPGEGSVKPENPGWVTFARAMVPMMMPAAHAIAEQVPAAGGLKVLDIAAGHGMFGIMIAKRNQQAEITAVDWAAVLEVATENAAQAGVSPRYRTLPGSAFEVDFGTDYDVVLLTNFLHHFDARTNETLLRKVCAALKPGGRAVILEFVPNEDRVSPPIPAGFALSMLMDTKGGDAYTFRELESMCRNAGFQSSVHHRLETQQSVIISTK